jgi:putative aldouronate transport system substrate-binding protein
MREWKKIAALTLVSAAVITGCAAQKGSGSAVKHTSSSDESSDPVTFVFYNADGVSDPWTDPVAKKITEATGVTLQTEFPSDGDSHSVDLMIADGDYPDLIFAKNDVSSLVEAGALLDLTDLINEYGPNIKKLYGDDLKKLRYSVSDSSIYQLCSYQADEDVLETSGTAQLQWAVLKNSNYKIPYTLADYENEIRDYMKKNPEIGGQPRARPARRGLGLQRQ